VEVFMITVKNDRDVPVRAMDVQGAKDVTMQVLIGPEDGSGNIIMRFFRILKDGHTPVHEHVYEHVIHVQKGQGVVIGQDGGERTLRPGMSVLVPGGVEHQFKNLSDEPFEFICTIPNPDRFPQAPACMG
jgi:quercetin dioxygenase-like cupin family protein